MDDIKFTYILLKELKHKIKILNIDGCIQVVTTIHRPVITINRKQMYLHRVLLSLVESQPFPEAQALHTCDNKLCINVFHLYWGTYLDNMQDRIDRHPRYNKSLIVKDCKSPIKIKNIIIKR